MNLIDAKVKKVLSKPEKRVGYENKFYWLVEVEYIDMGGINTEKIMFMSEEEALKVTEGYVYQH